MKKVYKRFQTLSEIARAKAMATCDPSKPYFKDLLHYHEQELADRVQEDYIKDKNRAVLKEIIGSTINSLDVSDRYNKEIETPGLKLGEEEISHIQYDCFSANYVSEGKSHYLIEEEKLMTVIEYFQSKGFLPENLDDIKIDMKWIH